MVGRKTKNKPKREKQASRKTVRARGSTTMAGGRAAAPRPPARRRETIPAGSPEFVTAGTPTGHIDVKISYRIIHLFSEGLYRSPHKAVEELL